MIGNVHVNPGVLAGVDATVGIRATVDHWMHIECTVHVRGGEFLVTPDDAISPVGWGVGSDGKGLESSILMRCGLKLESMEQDRRTRMRSDRS